MPVTEAAVTPGPLPLPQPAANTIAARATGTNRPGCFIVPPIWARRGRGLRHLGSFRTAPAPRAPAPRDSSPGRAPAVPHRRRCRQGACASQAVQVPAGIMRDVAKLFGDAEQLVVLRDTLAARGAAGLDLADAGRDGEIRDEGVFGFAGAVRDHGAVAVAARQVDALQRLGECA